MTRQELLANKLITERQHPAFPLRIYNYSPSAMATPAAEWPDSLTECRGLVVNAEDRVVARPFRKFWNYEQVVSKIPQGPWRVYEKLDGSLGIVFLYDGVPIVATRGSFESEQAEWANFNWMPRIRPHLKEGITYLFEIIYPSNRIVVNYGDDERMDLLAAIDTETGIERDDIFDAWPLRTVSRYPDNQDPQALLNLTEDGTAREGFVLRWENGFRAKIKLADYKRLHRLLTQCSTRTIWELMRAGKPLDEILSNVPPDFRDWVQGQADHLQGRFDEIRTASILDFSAKPIGERKAIAEVFKTRQNPSLLFAMLDGKPIEDMIWKLVEPKWATPFRRDEP